MQLPDISGKLSQLSDTVFSTASIEGIVIIALICWLIFGVARKMKHLVGWILGVIFVFEVGHLVAYSSLGNWVPELRTLFKYDVLTAVAQLFVGTPVCEWILYIQSFLSSGISRCADLIVMLWNKFQSLVRR